MENFKEVVSVLGMIGIPSIGLMTMWCIKTCIKFAEELKIIREAIQSNMRSDLLNDYKRFKTIGYIETDDLTEWENRYQKYHKLGENGILDAKRQELLILPNTPRVGQY